MTTAAHKPLKVFCSYSHKDEEFLNELRTWLRSLERQGRIEWWHDREISPGREWEEAIDRNLRTAEVILLLVTPAFMASDYVYEKEIGQAVARHERGEARVIPIIARPADWKWAPFGKLQALPRDARPITTWSNQDEAWLDVASGIRKAVEELSLNRQERAARGEEEAKPPDKLHAGTPRHNLPAQRSSFVGRKRELEEVRRELTMTRLLTLTGAGGSGKTRLALEVARELLSVYPDGAWMAELAPLSEGELVPQAAAEALGIREQPGQSPMEALTESLREKRTLLVLDNCEHLIEAAAQLADTLLDSCAHLRVLATSREALGVEGEVVWQVAPLSVPDADRASVAADLAGFAAVRLFVDRARQRDPAFVLTPQNAKAVAEVCRRLDGIPLAIELAAARVGALSVEQVALKLERSLELLTGGRRTVPRQRTVRGALDWSYALLSEAERTLLRRLSVFAGGWTLEAAEAVAPGDSIGESDVLDLLSGLVDKSLVVAEEGEQGGMRYRMLEPVRQYALEKCEECGEADAVQRAHAEYFLALAEEVEPELVGPQEAERFERLYAEYDNIRTALSWALERGEAELGLRLSGALGEFWEWGGHYFEGRRWLEEALAKDGRASASARAKALNVVCWLAMDQGDIDRAVALAEEGLQLSDEAGLGGVVTADFQRILGESASTRGDYERAKELFEEALVLYRIARDRRSITWSLANLAGVSMQRGDYERAKELYEKGLALSRELGGAAPSAMMRLSLGYVYLLTGDYERATVLNEEAAALLRERGLRGNLQYALDNLGWAALLRGDHERAEALYEESLRLCRELGDRMIAAESLEGLACAAAARGEAERAAKLFGAARALQETVGYHQEPRAHALREPYLEDARSGLDAAAWEATFAEGKAMGLEDAIGYALSVEEPASPAPPAVSNSD